MYQPPHLRTAGGPGPGPGAGYAPSSSSSSPPPPDAYRSQAYQAFSPSPPIPAQGFSPMSSGSQSQSQRFQQFSSPPCPAMPYHQRQPPQSQPQGYRNGYGGGAPPPQQQQQQARHKGTLAPGTMVAVGEHQVRVEKYLSEGGYAHVYLTRSERPIYPPTKGDPNKKGRWGERGFTEHCLKRIAFEDDSVWVDVKKEIEVMKALPPNPHLVQYLGSTHNRTSKGHEVFILMEFCAGGGIIDLLNKRLRDRLKEAEILNIFTDVCEAVAAMHALKQPLLHRDLKIENVLSTNTGSPPTSSQPMGLTFKLCDFGSTTFPSAHPPNSKVEADAQAMDLNRHTTLQYRSPEMVEPMLGLPVGLPSDVWALGVLLYKLCYYTTPFEEHGTLAIVNAKYSFPQYPVYSPRIQHLIASMLVEQPIRRPTVFDILRVAHEMSGTRPEVDYPASWSKEISRSTATSPLPSSNTRQSSNLLDFSSPASTAPSSPAVQSSFASNIQPQRRGRPTREPSSNKLPPMPQPPAIPMSPSASAPKMQVTGERPVPGGGGRPIPSAQSSIDAFGLPSAPKAKTQGSTSSGFSDSFATSTSTSTTRPFRPTSRFGRGLSQNHSGFGDSFTSPAPTGTGTDRSPQINVHAATPQSIDKVSPAQLEIPQTASPARTGSGHPGQAQGQGQDQNFETRYPSIETLSSGDASTPTLISPITSPQPPAPPNVSRPSMLGNMTGGDLNHNSKQPMQHLGIGGDPQPQPQPRSTHVTGTAFKRPDQGEGQTHGYTRSPSPIKDRKAYFEGISANSTSASASAQKPKKQEGQKVDLMTGEAGESMGADEPLINRTGSSTGAGPSRSRSVRSARQTTTEAAAAAALAEPDSSDDEHVPESASHGYANMDDASGARSASPTGPGPEKSASLPPLDELPSSSSSRQNPGQSRERPQTMYTSPTQTELSLPTGGEGGARPGHTRKGSINSVVSKFEGLNPPSSSASPSAQKSVPSERSSRPTPATKPKPAQLKKPTLDTVRVEGGGQLQNPIMPNPTPTFLPSSEARGTGTRTSPALPTKPQGLSSSRAPAAPAAGGSADTRGGGGGKKSFGETPRPDGFSRSSSGRSFPIVKPKPGSVVSSTTTITTDTATPERQQSVKAMAARWNQGDMAKPAVVKPKPVL